MVGVRVTAAKTLMEALQQAVSGQSFIGHDPRTDKKVSFDLTDVEVVGLTTGTHVVVAKDELQRQFKAGYECGGNGA